MEYNACTLASLHIIYASSTGHTEYVIDTLVAFLELNGISDIEVQKAERATDMDLSRGDILLLACGTWNTGGSEGQLNTHMYDLLRKRAKDVNLQEKKCVMISLGDTRYYFTARATEHLRHFITTHNGKECCTPLVVINDPYDQDEKIQKWAEKHLLPVLQ